MRHRLLLLGCLLAMLPGRVVAEEIYLQDGKRLMAMVETISSDGKIALRLPTGGYRAKL